MGHTKTLHLLGFLSLCLIGCARSSLEPSLVIWVTGGLHGEWLPHGHYGQLPAGGLSRIARALELYRQPGDLLVDLGQFRYPQGITGQIREWRIRADGFLKSLARMEYSSLNVSLADLPPWPRELAAQAGQFGLPLVSGNVGPDSLLFPAFVQIRHEVQKLRIFGLTGGNGEFRDWVAESHPSLQQSTADTIFNILLTDAPEEKMQSVCDSLPNIDLILWLNPGKPVARQLREALILGMGNQGNCLGRIEIRGKKERGFGLEVCDLSGWLDHKPYRHHPVRETFLSKLLFWRTRPMLRAYLWEVPESLSPQKEAETQRKLTDEEIHRLYDLEEIHRQAPTEFAGPRRCLDCHSIDHPWNLLEVHEISRPQVWNYPAYERCLPCHATGFDDPGGFLLPWERPDLLTVTCEACHGGSYRHALEGEEPQAPIPDASLCQSCHDQEKLPPHHP